jgi:putative serine protease PepD
MDEGVPVGPLAGHEGPGFPDVAQGRGRPRRRDHHRTAALAVTGAAGVLLVGVGGGYAGAQLHDDLHRPAPVGVGAPLTEPAPARTAAQPSSADAGAVRAVAAAVLPSVVAVQVDTADGAASGSGFVIRSDGLLLTNNHVIADATGVPGSISVVFADGSEADASVVGRTTPYDLAVLRVDRQGLAPLQFADSTRVAVGDPVVAIGSPLGLQGTVTTGIVSAVNRPVAAGEDQPSYIDALQTDAAINPGNSGGPLVDLSGRVVGVTSAIARSPGTLGGSGSIGLGFAIPSAQALGTSEQLIATGHATYPVIGVVLDPTYDGEGVRVSADTTAAGPPVTRGGPADRAGIRPGDVITRFQGHPVTQGDQLIVAIRAQRPGDTVTLTVRRDGREREVRLTLDGAESD